MTSIEQQPHVVEAIPIKVVKDPILLHNLEKAFGDQLTKIKRGAQEHRPHGEQPIIIPTIPKPETQASENDNSQETAKKDQRKRGRKTTTKRVLEVPFSFELPTFCLEENIDLDIVLLNRFKEGESWGKHVPKFSVEERLQNWVLEKRERCKHVNKNETKKSTSVHQDCYFRHLTSQQTLRSQPEVINFLLHGDFPQKSGRKKAKLTKDVIVHKQESIMTCNESSKREEMPTHLPDIVNKVNNSDKEESEKVMDDLNNDGKQSNEMDNEVISNVLKNKMENTEMEIMVWDEEVGMYKIVDSEIENGLMVEELLNQPGELLIMKPLPF
ncbi:hypothetical protein VNO78_06689 [Psophocarpus tetragonolobus]|uniref:Uncharacterized protein n=1 Tax=Psophocarpus tetragonolobus TaxID=3891 RepID=A0AAN9XRA7_PSOTE